MASDPIRVQEVYLAALEKPEAERAALLELACGDDHELRQRVKALLATEETSESLSLPVAEPEATREHPPGPGDVFRAGEPAGPPPLFQPGLEIAGRYTLLERIGEGGMGQVWVASQAEPIKRQVALKLIKPGMDSRRVLARFELERQTLALMDHPNIARVLDGGMTDQGRPYFVMELVDGLPLTTFCDRARLTLRERLELFVPICQAVQHAHQKGIIHRDLKPSNILVALYDGRPVPRVIDFGVAKATGTGLGEDSMATQVGTVIGSFEYMSPEQAGFSAVDVDTRSDIYSLGVVLYELLTGLLPVDGKRLRRAPLDEVVRLVREEEALWPPARLASEESLPALAAARQTEPRKLRALLRGELSWIVMKCLEKQRERRYETANALARDIQRYLADEPVEARPTTTWYRLGKLLRRHRGPVLAACLLVLVLLGGILGTTLGLIEARRQKGIALAEAAEKERAGHLARQRQQEAEGAARSEAIQRARAVAERDAADRARRRARAVLDAMTSAVAGNSLTTQKEITPDQKRFLAEVLTYYREFAGEGGDDEGARARTAGAAFRVGLIEARLGRKEQAVAAYRMARDAQASLAADFPARVSYRRDLGWSHNNLALLLRDLGKRGEAEEHYRRALAIKSKLAQDFPDEPEYRQDEASTHNNLGALLNDLERWSEAEEHHQKALVIREKLATDHPAVPDYRRDLAGSHYSLGNLFRDLQQPARAREHYQTATAQGEKLMADVPTVPGYRQQLARTYNNLGRLLWSLGERAEAEDQLRLALAIKEKLVQDFPAVPAYRQDLARGYSNVGGLLARPGSQKKAEDLERRSLTIREKLVAEFPTVPGYRRDLAGSHHSLAFLLTGRGQSAEAEKHHRQVVALREELAAHLSASVRDRRDLAWSHLNLGNQLAGAGKLAEAGENYHKGVALFAKLADTHPAVPDYQVGLGGGYCNLGNVLRGGDRPGDSLPWYDRAIATLGPVVEQAPRHTAARRFLRNSYWGRARAHDQLGKHAPATSDWDQVVALSPREQQPEFRASRSSSRARAGRLAEAISEIDQLTRSDRWGAVQWYGFAAVHALAGSGLTDNKQHADRAMALLRRAVEAGYRDGKHLGQDPDFASLRDRQDFKKLIDSLPRPEESEQPPSPR